MPPRAVGVGFVTLAAPSADRVSRVTVPIGEYAMVGDRETAALISRAGSVDWLCLPRFDSPACFSALLGTPEHGRWLLTPVGASTSTRAYREGSLVLETTHETDSGTVVVVDVMPVGDHRADLVRIVRGERGSVRMRHEWIVRFGYGKTVPWVTRVPDASSHGADEALQAIAGPDRVTLRGPRLPTAADSFHTDEFDVRAGDELIFNVTWSRSYHEPPTPLDVGQRVEDSVQESRQWLSGLDYSGRYVKEVRESLLLLRAMTHMETGGIVAAPTTSLPEILGGERNWDYRYCWLRDAALTVEAMLMAGLGEKSTRWRDWLTRAIAGDPADLQIMYAIDGGRELPERTLEHLPGYENSVPVRVGNGAVGQKQSDVLGEVMIALDMLREAGLPETPDAWDMQRVLVNDLATHWREPDHGLWEIRGPARRFTHSRVMVWAAFDRAIRAGRAHGLTADVKSWIATRDEVREAVMTDGFNAEINSFTQHDETTEVDASLLVLPIVGFIEATDRRFTGTVQRIERDLVRDGLVLRYRTSTELDGLRGEEHPFVICSFWLVSAYALMGRVQDACELMDRLLLLRNDLGLLAEEYDPQAGRQMGNFPQAFSHLGLVHAAHHINVARAKAR